MAAIEEYGDALAQPLLENIHQTKLAMRLLNNYQTKKLFLKADY